MASPLSGKVVWLTGASSGIGEAFAHELAKTGCKLVLTARRADVLQKLTETLNQAGGTVTYVAGNVADRTQIIALARQIENQLGPVDVLIANAGTHIPTEVERFETREYESIMQINFFGVLNCIEAVLPSMIARKSGHLVAVSSVAGYRALPRAAAYGASKSALSRFMDSIRFDLVKHNVDVTVISPGFVKTPLTDKNDFPMPFLIEADVAAKIMLEGVEKRRHEVHFPKKFTMILKFLQLWPHALYHRLILAKVVPK